MRWRAHYREEYKYNRLDCAAYKTSVFAEMISNIENQAYKRGYRILLCNSQSIEEKEREYIDICTGNRVAGIILCSGTVSVELFDGIHVPVITMERFLDNGTAAVECDNRQGGALAAQN